MAKRKYCLIPSEREKECYNHTWTYMGETPGSGSEQCMYCGLRRRIYIPDDFRWIGENGERTNRCPTCNRIRCRPDPRMVGEPITDPIPEWGCLEIWCGYELDEWRPMWQSDVLT
jgi:hypothetical protein